MKKILSLLKFKEVYQERPDRIILYGAGKRGRIIATVLERFGFTIDAFVGQNPDTVQEELKKYLFISVDQIAETDYVFITPESKKAQDEIEVLLQDHHVDTFYYFDCNWNWYDDVISCYDDIYGTYDAVEDFEREYCALKQKHHTINVYTMWAGRVGEFIYRFWIMQLAFKQNPAQYNVIVPWTPYGIKTVANNRLMTIFGRYLNIILEENSEFWKYVFLWHASELNSEKCDYYDKYMEKEISLWDQPYQAAVEFTEKELEEARRKYEKLQIQGEFVCIHARDSYYLAHATKLNKDAWAYHDYRDYSIYSYNKLVDYLAQNNISAVRVGNGGNEKYEHRNVVDFAIDSYDELVDLYLNSMCKYYISCPTGAQYIPRLFGRKIISINFTKIIALSYFFQTWEKEEIFISKLYFSKSKNRYLSMTEMLEFDLRRTEEESAGIPVDFVKDIIFIENTEEDILNTYIEADQRFCGVWQDDAEEKRLQYEYSQVLAAFCRRHPVVQRHDRDIHDYIVPISISSTFLKHYPFLVEEAQQ